MTMILTNKQIERDEQRRKYAAKLEKEHHQLALDKAMLLDFVYLAASSKRSSGEFSNSRQDLRDKADKILTKLYL
jgi:hypothetical protein